MNLKGKTAIVTGATKGVGAACARAFASHGARVVLADVNAEACRSTASEIESSTGAETLGVSTEVADPAQCEALSRAAWTGSGNATSC